MAQWDQSVLKVWQGLQVPMARMASTVRQAPLDQRGRRDRQDKPDPLVLKALKVRQGLWVPMVLKVSQARQVPPDPRELTVHLAQLVPPGFKVR